MIKVRTLLKNNTGAIFQKTIAQKQTNRNLFIIDHCHRCSLASSHVRCSDVGKIHNRSELYYQNINEVDSISMPNGMISNVIKLVERSN